MAEPGFAGSIIRGDYGGGGGGGIDPEMQRMLIAQAMMQQQGGGYGTMSPGGADSADMNPMATPQALMGPGQQFQSGPQAGIFGGYTPGMPSGFAGNASAFGGGGVRQDPGVDAMNGRPPGGFGGNVNDLAQLNWGSQGAPPGVSNNAGFAGSPWTGFGGGVAQGPNQLPAWQFYGAGPSGPGAEGGFSAASGQAAAAGFGGNVATGNIGAETGPAGSRGGGFEGFSGNAPSATTAGPAGFSLGSGWATGPQVGNISDADLAAAAPPGSPAPAAAPSGFRGGIAAPVGGPQGGPAVGYDAGSGDAGGGGGNASGAMGGEGVGGVGGFGGTTGMGGIGQGADVGTGGADAGTGGVGGSSVGSSGDTAGGPGSGSAGVGAGDGGGGGGGAGK